MNSHYKAVSHACVFLHAIVKCSRSRQRAEEGDRRILVFKIATYLSKLRILNWQTNWEYAFETFTCR